MKNDFKNRQKGFTLTELIVTIAIISIISASAYVFIARIAPHYRLAGASQEVISAIRKAQNEAVTKQYIFIIRFDTSNQQYSIIRFNSGIETIEETIDLPKTISFSGITLTKNESRFTNSGAPQTSGDAGTITLSNPLGENITITITPSGQVKTN